MNAVKPWASAFAAVDVATWVWAGPVWLFVLGTPLWMHVWEPGMFLAINHACMALPAQVWTGLSLLGNAWGILAVTAPLLAVAPRLMWAWLCAAPFAIAFARTGKFFIESPRPAALVDPAQFRVVGELLHNVSMPSGHTLTAFAVASGLYFALPRVQRARAWWLWLLAAGTGLSRIAVGAHWPGDVAVGAALGMLSGLLGNALLTRVPAHWQALQHRSMRAVACLVALAVYTLLTEPLDFDENLPIQRWLALWAVVSLAVFARRSARSLKAS